MTADEKRAAERAAEIDRKLKEEPDFIASSHHQNSLARLRKRYQDGVPDHVVARVLKKEERDLNLMWARTIQMLRRYMGIKKGE